MIVLDEAHYLKNHDAKRTRLIYGPRCDGINGVVENVPKVVLLSGTPAPNNTAELWPHLRATYPQAIPDLERGRPMNLWQFRARYSVLEQTQYGERVIGSKNTASLRQACAPYFIRIRGADVLKDLPPIVWSTDPVAGEAPPLPRALQEAAGLEGEQLLQWMQGNDIALATVRRLFGMAKVAGSVEWIDYFLENNPDRSLVVFAHHRDVLLALAGRLQAHQPIVVHGGTPLTHRAAAVEQFQARKGRLWLGQMQASGTAITLTAASDVLFVEQDWTPSTMAQAAARTHRIGQTRPVMARVLYLDDSLDDAISEVLTRKAREIAQMFDHSQKEAAE
jgi:SWI/SNF-related matrix-associated actin-dependent regulator 1 of chromatin subfamily A